MSSTVKDLEDSHVLGKQGTVEIILQNILVVVSLTSQFLLHDTMLGTLLIRVPNWRKLDLND